MNLLKWLASKEYKWLWYGGTLVGSALPILMRVFLSLDKPVPSFDLKDLLFMGLAINLSNFNLIGIQKFEYKVVVVVCSMLFVIMMAFILGVLMNDESNHVVDPMKWMTRLSVLCVAASAILSYAANKHIFSGVNNPAL